MPTEQIIILVLIFAWLVLGPTIVTYLVTTAPLDDDMPDDEHPNHWGYHGEEWD